MALAQYVPPVLHSLRQRWIASREPVYANYDEATNARGEDYHDAELADVVMEKTHRLLQGNIKDSIDDRQAIATLLAVSTAIAYAQRNGRPLRVLDFGGALGTSYHLIREQLPGAYAWAVVETPVFVEAGKPLETHELRMFETIDAAYKWLGEVDLVYTSSAIQYVPDPLGFVDRLLAVKPRCVSVLRTAFSRGRQKVVLQKSRLQDNGPGSLPAGVKDRAVYYPRTYASLPDFLDRLKDYHTVTSDPDGSAAVKIDGEVVEMGRNYLFVRKSDA